MEFVDSQNIMTRIAEASDYREVAALVGEKSHDAPSMRADGHHGLVRNRVSCVVQRGPDVVRRQPRIGIEKISYRRTLGQLPEQKLNRYPRSADYRLTLHDARVDLDPLIHDNRELSSI